VGVEAVAVVQDAPEDQRGVLEAAAIAEGAQPDRKPRDQAEIEQRGVEVARENADVGLAQPVRLELPRDLEVEVAGLTMARLTPSAPRSARRRRRPANSRLKRQPSMRRCST
jgi:hypothetical protein